MHGSGAAERKRAFDDALAVAQQLAPDEEAVRRTELAALVEFSLGEELDRETFDALAAIQAWLKHRQADLAARLVAGTISREAYLDSLNDALETSMEQSRRLLGDARFEKVFGETGEHPRELIDRDRFLHQ
jgi:hypothetical protein